MRFKPGRLCSTRKKGAIARTQTAAGLACMLTAGCAFGPDFYEPAAPNVTGFTKKPLKPSSASDGTGKGQGQRFVENLDIPGQWWETFHSRPLNDLIEDALKQSGCSGGSGWLACRPKDYRGAKGRICSADQHRLQ